VSAQTIDEGSYGGFFLGASDFRISERTGYSPAYGQGESLVLGVALSSSLRGEVELSRASADVKAVADGSGADPATRGVDFTYLMANAWYALPTRRALQPYAGGGVGVAWVEGEGAAINANTGPATESAFAAQLGFGVRYLADSGDWDLGYRYKHAAGAELDLTPGETTRSTFAAHSLNVGYTFNF
jgi:opacity protein-like surface antigen